MPLLSLTAIELIVGTTELGTLHGVDFVTLPSDTPFDVNVSTVTNNVPCVPFGIFSQKLIGIIHVTEETIFVPIIPDNGPHEYSTVWWKFASAAGRLITMFDPIVWVDAPNVGVVALGILSRVTVAEQFVDENDSDGIPPVALMLIDFEPSEL